MPGNAPLFLGRTDELRQLLGKLKQSPKPGSAAVLGERRIGKSSLLQQLLVALRGEAGLICVHGDAQSFENHSPAEFFRSFSYAITKALPAHSEAEISGYAQLQRQLHELAPHYRVLLMLDEFEHFAANSKLDAQFFYHLRALGSDPQCPLGYLLASRSPIKEVCKKHKHIEVSDFWNLFGSSRVLGLLTEEEAEKLIQEPLRRTLGGTLKTPQKQEMLKLTGRHPGFIQMLMLLYWNNLQQKQAADWSDYKGGLVEYFETLWTARTEAEQALLWRIAAGGKPKQEEECLRLDLERRGVLTKDGKLFSDWFGEVIETWAPEKKEIGDYADAAEKALDKTEGWIDKFFNLGEKYAEKSGKIVGKFSKAKN
ncbi:MAG: ATP-binding protein, partial [Gammaproteobacteria bacterium]|nr:ATP-binding protein [Gammaproteobacteria bacterium]